MPRLGEAALLGESVVRHRGSEDAIHLGWSLRMLDRTLLLRVHAEEAGDVPHESLRLFAPSGDGTSPSWRASQATPSARSA